MKTSEHEVIFAIVNSGYAEDVMEVAREQGVRGGTSVLILSLYAQRQRSVHKLLCRIRRKQPHPIGKVGWKLRIPRKQRHLIVPEAVPSVLITDGDL